MRGADDAGRGERDAQEGVVGGEARVQPFVVRAVGEVLHAAGGFAAGETEGVSDGGGGQVAQGGDDGDGAEDAGGGSVVETAGVAGGGEGDADADGGLVAEEDGEEEGIGGDRGWGRGGWVAELVFCFCEGRGDGCYAGVQGRDGVGVVEVKAVPVGCIEEGGVVGWPIRTLSGYCAALAFRRGLGVGEVQEAF